MKNKYIYIYYVFLLTSTDNEANRRDFRGKGNCNRQYKYHNHTFFKFESLIFDYFTYLLVLH